MRLLDVALHACLAAILPGPWYYQFAPDTCVYLMFGYSIITNRWLSQNNALVRVSRGLHSPFMVVACGALAAFMGQLGVVLMLHWSCHLLIDYFTHDNWRAIEKDVAE